MQIRIRYLVLGFAACVAVLAPVLGQESRQFYKNPETAAEFWRAMNH